MTGLAAVNRFLSLYTGATRLLPRWRAWAPLVGFALICWLLLYALYDLSNPLFHAFAEWWVGLLDKLSGGSDSLLYFRFPDHLLLLADKFGWARFFAGLLFESLALGLTAGPFYEELTGRRPESVGRRSFMAFWLQLALGWLLVNLLTVLIGNLIPDLFPFLTRTTRRLLFMQLILLPGLFTLIFGLFLFVIPLMAAHGDSIGSAIVNSLKLFIRHPLTCLAIAASILFVPILLSLLSGYSSQLIERFRPELVYWLLAVGILVDLVANFFWMAVTVGFLAIADE